MKVVSVSFKKGGKKYLFINNDYDLKNDDYVIVDTEKGSQFGFVVNSDVSTNNLSIESLKPIVAKATDNDYDIYLKNLRDSSILLKDTQDMANKEKLDMKFVDAYFSFDKKNLVLNFIADERVDFRNLVKYLASKYKAHIELHQMGARDKAKEISGLGPCGMKLCCSRFKNVMDGISINMAKNQNLSLNPSKINGACGRLLCCLSYEDDNYKDAKMVLPKFGEIMKIDGLNCKVIDINPLQMSYVVDINGEKRKIDLNDK